MAIMFAEYLEANFEDFPSKRRLAARINRPVALVAADRNIGITLRFAPGLVSVEDGIAPDASATFSGPFFVLTKVASAQPIPKDELKGVRVAGATAHPVMVACCAALLRTPASFYEEGGA